MIDLSSAPTEQVSHLPRWLPWLLVAVATFALLLSVAPAQVYQPGTSAVAASEPVIDWQATGYSTGPTVLRAADGTIVAVLVVVEPYDAEPVSCRVEVDGTTVEVHADDGHGVTCLWVRGV